jgi:hypothetical protein
MKLRTIAGLVGVLIELLVVVYLKLLDSYWQILGVFVTILCVGIVLRVVKNKNLKEVGHGVIIATIILSVLVGGFLFWLSFNYPT